LEIESSLTGEWFEMYFNVLDMNRAIEERKEELFKETRQALLLMKERQSITLKTLVSGTEVTTLFTLETQRGDVGLEIWLNHKAGILTTGPISMCTAAKMVSRKALQLRVIYKHVPFMACSLKYPAGQVRMVVGDSKDPHCRSPYADRDDVAMLADSGMSLIILLFGLTQNENVRLCRISEAIKDGSYLDKELELLPTGESSCCDVGHVVCSNGNGHLISNFVSAEVKNATKAQQRGFTGAEFTLETLMKMGDGTGTYAKLGMFAYELVPSSVLAKRNTFHKTTSAESLLHKKSVPGCNVRRKETTYHWYHTTDSSFPSSKCLLRRPSWDPNLNYIRRGRELMVFSLSAEEEKKTLEAKHVLEKQQMEEDHVRMNVAYKSRLVDGRVIKERHKNEVVALNSEHAKKMDVILEKHAKEIASEKLLEKEKEIIKKKVVAEKKVSVGDSNATRKRKFESSV